MNPRNWHLVGPLGVNHFHWLPHCLLFWNCDAGRTLDQTSPASMRWDGGTTDETSKDVYGAEVESDARESEDTEEDLVGVLTHLTVTTNATAGTALVRRQVRVLTPCAVRSDRRCQLTIGM